MLTNFNQFNVEQYLTFNGQLALINSQTKMEHEDIILAHIKENASQVNYLKTKIAHQNKDLTN